jgi:RNA polymerase sigma factor (sigma-70 family)
MLDPESVAESEGLSRQRRLAQLLLSARAGKPESLEQIVTELTPVLWHVVRAHGLDREPAEDVIQHTWLTFLHRLDEIREPLALTAWLVTTARCEAWRVQAAQHAETPVESGAMIETPDPLPTSEESVLLGERQSAVWQAVHRLSPSCQMLLRIVAFVHRPDYNEVASALGTARGSVGPTRGRCLEKLRILLKNTGEGSPA